ncbi:DUF5331 domain-containing protein [Calothrix sp. UHCC 0171]|uniref:DUF5331 domain-containing protein n=1 Tax=Calothrix sp. UHCC 0171 TaxID=3110245 RepID=UPI002B221002|nr:DUF5331 domain-containing protein [Calothrix sp. UHCC 0171]MEA5569525.1 DUF5331 domain-containing protein [Calothrix sp. UHCC 0171]
MNIQELRQSLKIEWLRYYKNNRHWLEKMEIWATFAEERRPLSSFVLATVSVLQPNLTDILPLLAELNSDPDAVVAALGLNFNPDHYLHLLECEDSHLDSRLDSDLDAEIDRDTSDDFAHHQTSQNSSIVGNNKSYSQFVNTKPPIQVAVAKSYLNRVKSQPTELKTSVIPMSKNGVKSNAIVAVSTTVAGQGNIVKIIHDRVPGEINQSPVLHPRNLANWIDDFCQGQGWDKDEATFIPF